MPDVSLTGVSSSNPTPGVLTEVVLAAGQSGGFGGQRGFMILANATVAGLATRDTQIYGPDTPTPMVQESDVITLFGVGSEGHRLWRKAARLLLTASIPIYMVAVTESAGAKAAKQVTLLNVPSAPGNIQVFVGAEQINVAFLAGDTLATITANVSAAVNQVVNLPVVASQTTGSTSNDSFTLTAKNAGPRGNWIRTMVTVTFGNGGTPNLTVNGGAAVADVALSGGTTPDSNATALSTIAANRYYWVVSAAEDATQAGALGTAIGTSALPANGNRQSAFYGSVDTQSNVDTIVAALNNARLETPWLQGSPWTPAEWAVHCAAIYALGESQPIPRCNFSNYPSTDAEAALWGTPPAPRNPANWPTATQITIALNSGVSPIRVLRNGTTQLVKRVTNRCLNGSNPDYRIRDPHRRMVCDFFADDLGAAQSSIMAAKNLVDDPPSGVALPPNAISPQTGRNINNGLLNLYASNGLLQKTDASKAAMVVARQVSAPNRLGNSLPLYPIDLADQFWNSISQVA